LGLPGALRQATDLLERSGIRAVVTVHEPESTESADGDPALRAAAQDAVYFCCIEALQNVAKYADASCVEVTVVDDSDWISFTVRDDGHGFDPGLEPESAGGLAQLAERVSTLGGSLVVESTPGRGTQVRGSVPARPLVGAVG
jgi:signal transduction histidine kinase